MGQNLEKCVWNLKTLGSGLLHYHLKVESNYLCTYDFDEYLAFDDHIVNLCTKVSKSLFCINRVKNFVTQKTRKTLYSAMIHSHLVYCLSVYGCANKTSLKVHKIEIFFGFDFEICIISLLVMSKY